MSIKDKADSLYGLKVELQKLNEESKIIKEKIAQYEVELIQHLETTGLDQVRTENATFSLSTSIQPVAKDWEAIGQWIIENNAIHLLQRRISTIPYRELLDQGEEVDGIEPFEKTVVKTRKR